MSLNNLSCLIIRFPSLTSSSEPAKIPACPVFLFSKPFLKFFGIKSLIFFQSINLPKNSLILLMPSSVVKTGNLGILYAENL